MTKQLFSLPLEGGGNGKIELKIFTSYIPIDGRSLSKKQLCIEDSLSRQGDFTVAINARRKECFKKF